jgi:2-haloacid dehalogenase
MNRHGIRSVAIKALVFDAYGTLWDVRSVRAVADEAFPGCGEIIAEVWRQKQLEYSWLRTLMGRYEDFSIVTRDALAFTLRCLGLPYDAPVFQRIIDRYLHLDLYPDARDALAALQGRKLAILSNGSSAMLEALVHNTGLDKVLDMTISIDAAKAFKPSRAAYALIEARLGIAPADVLFVTSNPFDVCGAKAFGLQVAWIERVTPTALAGELADRRQIAASAVFGIFRTQMDELGFVPDYRLRALAELPQIVSGAAVCGGCAPRVRQAIDNLDLMLRSAGLEGCGHDGNIFAAACSKRQARRRGPTSHSK